VTTVLSGIQPTGQPQLGNYLGALRWWVDFQHQADAYYCIVDLHALTVPRDPAEVGPATRTMAALLLAAGLDPDTCTLFVQSHVPAHTQLSWILECTASYGEVLRMTQWKDKSARGGEDAARVGLLTYPVLMAADILAYQADRVPVGDLAERFNSRYGKVFTVPDAVIPAKGAGARIMDLQEPTRKMSKSSESEAGTLFLFDDPTVISRKIRRAVTDADQTVRYDPVAKPGVSNLLELLATATGRTPVEVADGYQQYGPLKIDTAEAVVALVTPIQERYRELVADPAGITAVLARGAQQANKVASATAAAAYDAVGLIPPTT
jgi:tryptophanyl-tRNA synthetase